MNEVINDIITGLNSLGGGFWDYAAGMFIQSSVLIVLVFIIDYLLRKRVRAVFRYCIWMLVFIKLILPPTLSLPTGIGYWWGGHLFTKSAILEQVSNPVQPESVGILASQYLTIPVEQSGVEHAELFAETAVWTLSSISWQGFIFLIWAVGVLVFSALVVQRMVFVKGLIAGSSPAKGRLLDMLEQCCRQVGVGRDVELRLSNNMLSPAVCGLFRPKILMPASLLEKLSKEKLQAVLIHELAHIKRGDIWMSVIQTVLQIIYFYNPLVWLANAMVRRVREQAVDETVLVFLGEQAKSYSNTLIDIAEMAFWRPNFSLRLIGVVESKKALHRRIKHILDRPIPKNAKLGIAGLAVIILAGCVLLPMARAKDSNQKPVTRNQNTEFAVTLANGITVELVGVCDYLDKPRCWQPDGSVLKEQIYVKREKDYSNGKYGFIIRVRGPEGLSFAWNKIDGSKGWWGSCTVLDNEGNRLEGYQAAVIKRYEGSNTTNIRVGIATGPWKTIVTHNGRSMTTTGGKNVLFSQAYESDNFVGITVSSQWRKDQVERIIAIDKNGQTHTTNSIGSVASGAIDQMTAKFYDLNLNDISEFHFQTRPYEWVEFKNVSLKAGAKTDVEIEVKEYREQQATLAMGLKKRLQNLVENFFKHNYRDITARKTIEWGSPVSGENGNMSIRYKYEATIWGKDKVIQNKIFTFDKEGKFVSVKKIRKNPTGSKAWLQELVEDFFKNNYRDITLRKTLEWGDPLRRKNGNYSIRYKYEATIWNKKKIIQNKVFTFDKEGNFVSVKDVDSSAAKLENLKNQRVRVQRDLDSAERAMDDVRKRWGITDLEQLGYPHTITSRLMRLEQEKDDCVLEIAQLEANIGNLKKDTGNPEGKEKLKNAKNDLIVLERKLETLKNMVQEAQAQKRDLDLARVQYKQRASVRDERKQTLDTIKAHIEKLKIMYGDAK